MKRFPASWRYGPSVLFDKFHPRWDNYDRRNNAIFLGLALGELNDLLREHGHITLNEALEYLGFDEMDGSEGDFEGWVLDPEPGDGDGYISFGIWDRGFNEGLDWINGKSDLIKLRFNVDRVPIHVSLQKKRLKNERNSQ
jgi:hypothetical protein